MGLSLNLQTLKVRLNPVRSPGSLSTEVDLAGGRLVLSDGRSKAFHLRFVLNTGDWLAIRSLTRQVKGDSSAINPKHGRLVGDSFYHTAGQRRFIGYSSSARATGGRFVLSHGRPKAIRPKHGRLVGDSSFTRPIKGDSSAILPKHGRLVGDSFSHTVRQRRFIPEPIPEP